MKRTALMITALLALAAAPARGDQDRVALGVMVGEPTGLTGKVWLAPATAVDAGLSWSLVHHDRFHLHADYLHHDYGLFAVDRGFLPLYYGVGGRLLLDHRNRLGVRVPVGLSYLTDTRRFEFFMEIAPTVDLVPDPEFDVGGALGARVLLP